MYRVIYTVDRFTVVDSVSGTLPLQSAAAPLGLTARSRFSMQLGLLTLTLPLKPGCVRSHNATQFYRV